MKNHNKKESENQSPKHNIERQAQKLGEFLKLINYPVSEECNEVHLLTRTLETRKKKEVGRKSKQHGENGTLVLNADYSPNSETKIKLKYLKRLNQRGLDVFYIVNGQGTKKDEISYLNCLYIDIDKDTLGNPIPKKRQYEIVLDKMGGLEPTVVVDTGGKSLHFYFTFDSPVKKENGLPLLNDLLEHIGVADKACKDETRILRLPGFLYQKIEQETPPRGRIFCQTGNKYSFEKLRKIIPSAETKIKPKKEKRKKLKSHKTINIEGLNEEETAKKVLGGKTLEYWLEAPDCRENQDSKFYAVVKELAAGVRKGYFPESVGKNLSRTMMSNFPTLRREEPWEENSFIEKWNRAINDNSIEYNNENKVLDEINFDKLDEEFCKLAPGDKNRMILALLKGGHNLSDADDLMSTPVKKNILTGNIEYLGVPMEIPHILTEFENKFNLTTAQTKFTRIIEAEAEKNLYNPVEEKLFDCFIRSKDEKFFVDLKVANSSKWQKVKQYYNTTIANYALENQTPNATFTDVFPPIKRGIKNIEEFVRGALGTDDIWDIDFTRKFLISAVARAINPGCKVDNMLVIRSTRQGLYKSTFFEELAFGGEFYTNKRGNDVTSKDAVEALSRGWINEIDEIERVTCTRDAHDTKSFISQKNDTYRAAYERISIKRDRHWVLAGTSNDDTLFLDSENRRYNVVSIDKPINISFVKENLEFMWALVVELYLQGEKWFYVTGSEGAEVTRERNKQYMYQDARSELVLGQIGTHIKYVDKILVAKLLEGFDITHHGNCMPSKKSLQEAQRMLKKFDWKKPDEQRVTLFDRRRVSTAYVNPNYIA